MKFEQVDPIEFKGRLSLYPSLKREARQAPELIQYFDRDGVCRAEIRREYCVITQSYKPETYWFEEWLE